MRPIDRIYRTFEEFEREELRRMETVGSSVTDMLGLLIEEEELDFAAGDRRQSRWDAEEE